MLQTNKTESQSEDVFEVLQVDGGLFLVMIDWNCDALQKLWKGPWNELEIGNVREAQNIITEKEGWLC